MGEDRLATGEASMMTTTFYTLNPLFSPRYKLLESLKSYNEALLVT